jgi:hypothetical protein
VGFSYATALPTDVGNGLVWKESEQKKLISIVESERSFLLDS